MVGAVPNLSHAPMKLADLQIRRRHLLELCLLGAAMLGFISAALAYYLAFNSLPWGSPAEWAQFGDYFGGVVNPLIGVLTVVLIVETLAVTRKEAADTRTLMKAQATQLEDQVEHLKQEQQLADMHRRLEGVLVEWNRMMDRPAPRVQIGLHETVPTFSVKGRGTIRDILEDPKLEIPLIEVRKSNGGKIPSRWRHEFKEVVFLMIELADYCKDYEQVVLNTKLTDYYRKRVQLAFTTLRAAGMLTDGLQMELIEGGTFDFVAAVETKRQRRLARMVEAAAS